MRSSVPRSDGGRGGGGGVTLLAFWIASCAVASRTSSWRGEASLDAPAVAAGSLRFVPRLADGADGASDSMS